jgi:hypothetical protein
MAWKFIANIRGQRGPRGEAGKSIRGLPGFGDRGPIGPMPRHEWKESRLRFEIERDKWGPWVELRGKPGDDKLFFARAGPTTKGGGGRDSTLPELTLKPTVSLEPGDSNNSPTVGVSASVDALGLDSTKSVGIDVTYDMAVNYNAQSLGVDVTGSAFGAPLWQAIATADTQAGAAASLTINKPAGTIDGDFLLAFIGKNTIDDDVTAPAGWTKIEHTSRDDLVTDTSLTSFRKFASAEGASYVFTTVASVRMFGSIHRISAVDTTTPVDVVGENTGDSTDPIAPSITTTVANTLKICACAQANAVDVAYVPPANYTERADQFSGDVMGVTGEVATRPQNASGASGTATMDSDQPAASDWCAQHIALRPASFTLA